MRRWKHLTALTQAEQETILTRSVVQRARQQIGLFTSILLTVSAVIIALIIYTMTMDKIREIATLKLIGAPDRTIISMIVQQAVALGFTGFLLGAALISSVKDYFPRRVVLQPEDGLALAAIVLVVCLVVERPWRAPCPHRRSGQGAWWLSMADVSNSRASGRADRTSASILAKAKRVLTPCARSRLQSLRARLWGLSVPAGPANQHFSM